MMTKQNIRRVGATLIAVFMMFVALPSSAMASTNGGRAPVTTALAAPHTAGTGSISGVVSVLVAGSPLSDICISAQTTGGNFGGATTSAVDGTYTISGLAAGGYTVWFNDCNQTGNYASQYYDGATGGTSSYQSATSVSVTVGATTSSINAQMSAGGSISGTVTNGSTGLAGICISAQSTGGGLGGAATTGSTGTYTISGLAAGSYKVQFNDCNQTGNYASQYYTTTGGTSSYQSATSVSVTVG
ncbi:MAG: hypothetical protein HIU84_01025, partial [Acidobacteria bacterium]|nr:hypothetical protein [Acidobacteriota bacterium]